MTVASRAVRRRWPWVAGGVVVGTAAFVLFWFQPQKLFIDERVEERAPISTHDVARGEFVSLDHGTTGLARVVELRGGRRVLRLEGLDTSNGPALYVYLTANPAHGRESAFDDDYVDLGALKGNQGDQNYAVPPGTDLRRFGTVVIWCDRFDAAFGAADLRETRPSGS